MVETPDQNAVATPAPPDAVLVPPMPPPDEPRVGPPTPSADRAQLEMLQELLKLQQQATRAAMDQIEELKKQLSPPPAPDQTAIDESAQKAPPIVLPSIPAFVGDYWTASREELPELPPKYTGAAAAVITLAVALTIIVCCVVFWASSGTPLPWTAHPPVAPTVSLPIPVDTPPRAEPSTPFTLALGDLNDALALFPGKSPVDILWEASQHDSSCLLQWNDGSPSFLFGAGTPHPHSLAFTIGQCADAVRHLRSLRASSP